MKYGVCLYSFSDSFQSGKLNLENVLKRAKRTGCTGITMIGPQYCEQYPYPTDAWLENLRQMLKNYELEPLCWEAYIDIGLRNDRDLTLEEIAERTYNDIVCAHKAGFPLVKTEPSITPEIFERMQPLCKMLGVRLAIEMHYPHHPQVPVWKDEYFQIMERSEGWLGVVVDTGVFQTHPDKVLVQPEQLEEMLKYTLLIHGKFYPPGEKESEGGIPYEAIVSVLKKAGYSGYLAAEYEGSRLSEEEDEEPQVEQFINYIKQLYKNVTA